MPFLRVGPLRMSLAFRVRLEPTRVDTVLVAIVVLAAAFRLAYFTGLHLSDDPDYASRAFGLLKGLKHLYLDNNGLRIGTWYPAAAGYWLFGINNVGLVAYPLIMSIVAVVVIARLGSRLFDRRTGLLAALLLACYPLDVELATRLLPDALLSAWSAVAIFFLFRADLAQEEAGNMARLAQPWSYILSGALIGWCTAVNMSSVVLVVFIAMYFPASAVWLCRGLDARRALHRLITVCARRYGLLLLGFLLVAGIEATLYRLEFGYFFAKYSSTVGHYTSPDVSFTRDLWFYPSNMWFLQRGWHFQMPPEEYRPYGYFFIAALPCIIYGLVRRQRHFWMVALWLCSIFAYLQWGTMSASSWNLLHRLDRHLELVTPPLVLVIAAAIVRLSRRPLGAFAATVTVVALFGTSWRVIHARHQEAMSHLSIMGPIHSILEVYRPSAVFMDTQTSAYQRFLERFEDKPWVYYDIQTMSRDVPENSVTIVHSDNDFQPFARGAGAKPGSWHPLTTLEVAGNHGATKTIRVFQGTPVRLPPLDLERASDVDRHVRQIAPDKMTAETRVVFSWMGIVDGVERVEIRAESAVNNTLRFQPAREVISRTYRPLPDAQTWQYELISEAARGSVRIVELPGPANAFLLTVEVDDSGPAGAAAYRWFVVARPSKER